MAVSKKNQNESKPNNLLNNAQKVINSAVNVLEEEIAAGILAAKRIEKKVINVDEVRDDSNNLMNRIRKDTHEALDIFLDALAALSKQVGLLTDSVTKENDTKTKTNGATSRSASGGRNGAPAATSENTSIQSIELDKPVTAGSEITLSFIISDDAIRVPVKLDFQKTDFTGPANQKIKAKQIFIEPAFFTLQPGEEKEILVRVKLPESIAHGYYHSILTVTQMPAVKIVLSFEVK